MVKGVSIKFKSYKETVPALLNAINLGKELKKHDKIVLKPYLSLREDKSTPLEFVEEVLKYCLQNKNPVAEICIAEGSDGIETNELFKEKNYLSLSEKYSVGLIDLNNADTEIIQDGEFIKFSKINYPKILLDSFIISLPKLSDHEEVEMLGSLSNMLGAFPAQHYTGFFSSNKSKIRKHPIKYSIHDIIRCKMPGFSIIDASAQGVIIAGSPLEADKRAAIELGKNPSMISHIKLIENSFNPPEKYDASLIPG